MTAPLTALSHCPVPDLNYSLGVQVDICLLELLTKLMDRKNYSKHMIVFVDIVQWILVCKSFILTFIMPGGCIFFIAFLITCGKETSYLYVIINGKLVKEYVFSS